MARAFAVIVAVAFAGVPQSWAALSVTGGQLIFTGSASVGTPAGWNLSQPGASTFAPPPQTVTVATAQLSATANGGYMAALGSDAFSGAANLSHLLTDGPGGGGVSAQTSARLDMGFVVTQPGWYTLSGMVDATSTRRQAAHAQVMFFENAGVIFNIDVTASQSSLSFDRFLTPGFTYGLVALASTLSSNGDVPGFSGSASALYTWSVRPVPAPGAVGVAGGALACFASRRRRIAYK